MYKYLFAPLAAGLLLAGSAMAAVAQSPSSVTVHLTQMSNSGESGTATLTDNGNGTTTVTLSVTGEPAAADQPTHIHSGHCGQADFNPKPAFPLTDVKNGTSTTTVKTTLQSLLSKPYAINSHKSAKQITTYVLCGNITLAAQASASVPGSLPQTGGGGSQGELPGVGWVAAAAALVAAAGAAAARRRQRG